MLLTAIYWNSLRVPLIFDDSDSIAYNPTIRSWRTAFLPPHESGVTVCGRPVLNATFAFNHMLSGRELLGYRVTNIVVHWCAALVLFGVVRRALALGKMPLGKNDAPGRDWVALAVATIWAVHPLQTESVTYLVQRAESLVGLFYLLTIYCFLRAYAEAPKDGFAVAAGTPPSRSLWWAGLSVVACLMGMGSKEVMAGAPFVVFLFDRTYVAGSFAAAWRTRRWYYGALSGTWLLLAVLIVNAGARGGTVGFGGALHPWPYLLTQAEALVRYLQLAFWPHPLVLDYGRHVATGFGDVWLQAIIVVCLLVATGWACVRRPALGLIGACFFIVLAPTSSFIPVVSQTVAEHRMYLPLVSVVVLCCLLVARWGRIALLVFGVSTVVLLSGATVVRNHDYRSVTSIWSDTAKKRPDNHRAWLSLGSSLSSEGRYVEARDAFDRGLRVNPFDADLLVAMAGILYELGEYDRSVQLYRDILKDLSENFLSTHTGYHNLGLVLVGVGRTDEGVEMLMKAVSLKPNVAESHYALANALMKQSRVAEAISSYQRALECDSDHIKARANMGNALIAAGRPAEALRIMEPGLTHTVRSAELRFNLGVAESALGHPREAGQYFEECLSLNPRMGRAHVSLATLAASRGDAMEADRHFRAAAEMGERSAVLLAAWGRVLLKSGHVSDGVARLEEAVALAPGDLQLEYFLADAYLAGGKSVEAASRFERLLLKAGDAPELHNGLGLAYEQMGRLGEARSRYQRALMLRSDYEAARINLNRIQTSK